MNPIWIQAFVLLVYALALGCVYHAIRLGTMEYREAREAGYGALSRAFAAANQVGFLILFTFLFWLLESWAHYRTPFYVYDPQFPDLVARFPFKAWLPDLIPRPHECSRLVKGLMSRHEGLANIPFSIPLLEAMLTYSAMWTALLLGAGYRLAPFFAALVMVNIDLLLDPVVARAHDCGGFLQDSTGAGLGLWHWFHPSPGDASDQIADFLGIPLFNYAAWWSAPVALISMVFLVQWIRYRALPKIQGANQRKSAPERNDALVLGSATILLIALAVAVVVAPNDITPGKFGQTLIVGVVLAGSFALVLREIARKSFRVHPEIDPHLTRPLIVFSIACAFALLLEGVFLQLPLLILIGVGTIALGAILAWLPYREEAIRFAQNVLDADRFLRIHYLTFSLELVLMSAFAISLVLVPGSSGAGLDYSVAQTLGKWEILGLVMVGFLYHVWAYVLNDVIDLDLDRSQQRREQDPLVGGRIQVDSAIGIAVASTLGVVAFSFLLKVSWAATGTIVIGMLLMLLYNLRSKKTNFPPLMDLTQALGWGALGVYGMLAAAPDLDTLSAMPVPEGMPLASDPERVRSRQLLSMAIAIYGGSFIMLINGIHGGLRDLRNDTEHGGKTTAAWLGAIVDSAGEIRSNARIRAYAFTLLAVMLGVPGFVLFSGSYELLQYESWMRITWFVFFVLNAYLLWRVTRDVEPRRDRYIGWNLLAAQMPIILMFIPFLDGLTACLLIAVVAVPQLIQEDVIRPIICWVFDEEAGAQAVLPPDPGEPTKASQVARQ